MFGYMNADLSPLATYRAMVRIRGHIAAAYAALDNGVVDDFAATKFAKLLEKHYGETLTASSE